VPRVKNARTGAKGRNVIEAIQFRAKAECFDVQAHAAEAAEWLTSS